MLKSGAKFLAAGLAAMLGFAPTQAASGIVTRPGRRRSNVSFSAGHHRLAAMSISPAHGSSVKKLMRAQRIANRLLAAGAKSVPAIVAGDVRRAS